MQYKSNIFGAPPAKANAHRLRCKSLPAMQPGEAERLLAGFLATRSVTTCPAALCGTRRAAVASLAQRILTMRAYLIAAGMALGLLAGWAALVPFVV